MRFRVTAPNGPSVRARRTYGAIALVLLLCTPGLGSLGGHLSAAGPPLRSLSPVGTEGVDLLAAAQASLRPAAADPAATLSPWTNITSRLPLSPGYREGESMAYDPVIGQVLMFGGYTGTRYAGDTWLFSHDNWTDITPTLPTAPSPRQRAGLVFDTADQVMLLFGGHNGNTYYNDTWTFNGTAWHLLHPANAPSVREDAMMADEPRDHYVVLFGGNSNGTRVGDTWTFSNGTWTNISSTLGGAGAAGGGWIHVGRHRRLRPALQRPRQRGDLERHVELRQRRLDEPHPNADGGAPEARGLEHGL